ncbi:hypothetical protein [uncultured Nostoc sp.]|uniref:hypothetical protein n=1 Tax=uncultured Nostoc sp. TaxID=340711 RepID=UPI0035CC3DFD
MENTEIKSKIAFLLSKIAFCLRKTPINMVKKGEEGFIRGVGAKLSNIVGRARCHWCQLKVEIA